jgi:hypothetical protein
LTLAWGEVTGNAEHDADPFLDEGSAGISHNFALGSQERNFGQCHDGDCSEAKAAPAALNPHKAKDAKPSPNGLPLKSGSALGVTTIVSMPLPTMSAGHVAAQRTMTARQSALANTPACICADPHRDDDRGYT